MRLDRGRLVDDRVHQGVGEVVVLEPSLGEDVVDIDLVVEVGGDLDGIPSAEVPSSVPHEQGVQALVGCTLTAAHGVQPSWREVGLGNGIGFGAAVDPLLCITGCKQHGTSARRLQK